MTSPDVEILVIGAGLTGAVIAQRLAASGKQVAVFDAQPTARSATKFATGLVLADPAPDHGEDTNYGLDRLAQLAMSHQVPVRRLKASVAISDTQPFAASLRIVDSQPSLVMPLDSLAAALLTHPNIVLRENIEIHGIEHSDGVLHVLGNGYTVRARHVILAAGAFTSILVPEIAPALRVGRSAIWVSRPLDKKFNLTLPMIIEDGRMMVAQTADLRVRVCTWLPAAKIAATAKPQPSPDDANPQAQERISNDPFEDVQRFLRRYLRELSEETETCLSGVTVSTHDNAPLVGGADAIPGVIYAIPPHAYGPAWTPTMAEWVEAMVA